MPHESLQALIGTAVIDRNFQSALLNGSRRHVIQGFRLTLEETDAVMSIHAETLEQFAGQLHQWILKTQHQVEPPTLILPSRTLPTREALEPFKEAVRLPSVLSSALVS